ncbi:MAG: HEPN domain-containing protein [Candidatus Rokuibacteriota bacterium]
MAGRSRRKLIGQLTQPQYALLKDLTDGGPLDAPALETSVDEAIAYRLKLAQGFIRAARVLATNEDALVRRSAISRAYYGAYHAARATVFAVHHRDEHRHTELARVIDEVLARRASVGDALKELLRLRREMDYSPYPGPDDSSEYSEEEIERAINDSITRAERIVGVLEGYLQERR